MQTKTLPRLTVCELFKIGSPRWNGAEERREVGLNLGRIKKHNEIRFTYRRKSDGELSIPGNFYFDGDNLKGLDYEVQVRKGTRLVIVPFDHLERLVRE